MNGTARLVLAALVGGALALAGSAPARAGGEAAPCVEGGKIEKEIASEASLEELSCFIKDYKNTPSLHFKVRIKNVSTKPHRYRVNLFLDNGKAVGGLIPRKGKPPVVNPGEEASFTYPVKGLTRPPGSLTVLVKTLGD